jgi:putative flippase GtrA
VKRQVAQFALAGILGFVVDTSLLYLGLWIGLGYFIGRLISFLCAVFVTWQVNRTFTFSSAPQRSYVAEFLHYLAAMAAGGAVNYGVYSVVILWAPRGKLTPLFAVAAGAAVSMSINFVSAKFWVFRHR